MTCPRVFGTRILSAVLAATGGGYVAARWETRMEVSDEFDGSDLEYDQPPSSDPGEILVQHDAKGRG
jgi:hypothetical protein